MLLKQPSTRIPREEEKRKRETEKKKGESCITQIWSVVEGVESRTDKLHRCGSRWGTGSSRWVLGALSSWQWNWKRVRCTHPVRTGTWGQSYPCHSWQRREWRPAVHKVCIPDNEEGKRVQTVTWGKKDVQWLADLMSTILEKRRKSFVAFDNSPLSLYQFFVQCARWPQAAPLPQVQSSS